MAYFLGIDIGSLTCEAVIVDESGRVVGSGMTFTGPQSVRSAEKAVESAVRTAGLQRDDVSRQVATGYGRRRLPGRFEPVTEITCHAVGACHLNPETALVIDVGGQDSKAIRIGPERQVLDFAMNDKCSAGTGRFFEVMAHALEVDLDDFGRKALASADRLNLSTVCTVFAESEVVGMIAEGARTEDIAAALCRSAAERVAGLVNQVGRAQPITMTGGVARNAGFVRALETMLGQPIRVADSPEFAGALGAALIASRTSRHHAA